MQTLRTFSPLAHLKLRTAARILDRGHLLMAEEKLLRDPRIGHCVTFKGRIRFVPRIFHCSHSIAFAIISRCSLWFFLCYFSCCSFSFKVEIAITW